MNKYLFVFRSCNQELVHFIGVIVVGYEIVKATEVARSKVWNVTANEVIYGVLVDSSVEVGICFHETVERESDV